MPPMETQAWPSRSLSVVKGPISKFYFIPITGLQEGTHFRDLWNHLKEVIKRIEWIEIHPGSCDGWICVYKPKNFVATIDALRLPVYVKATKAAKPIHTCDKNESEAIIIKAPQRLTRYLSIILNHVTAWTSQPPNEVPSAPESTTTSNSPVIAHGTYIPGTDHKQTTPHKECAPVIAHGTWIPGIGHRRPEPASPIHSPIEDYGIYLPPQVYPQPFWGDTYTTPEWPCWGQSPSTQYSEPAGYPFLQAFHTVSLSGFHYLTSIRQIEKLVAQIAKRRRLRDSRYWVIGGVTVILKYKCDARKMREALDGKRLNGLPITATRGNLIWEF